MLRESDIEIAGGLTRPALGGALLRAGSARLIPRNRLVAFGGDSLSRQSLGYNASAVTLIAGGYPGWALFFSGQRVTFDPDHMFAVSGSRADELVASQLANLVACPAAAVHICTGINDVTQRTRTAAQIIADYETIKAALLAAGKLIIWAVPPTIKSWPTSARSVHGVLRRWILSQRPEDGIFAYDASEPMSDVSGTFGQDPRYCLQTLKEDGTPDLTHTTVQGGVVWGQRLAEVINAVYPPAAIMPPPEDLYDAADNPYGGWISNPYLTGTAGTFANGANGVAPSGYVADAGVADLGVVASKYTDDDGKMWAQLAVTGASANSNPRASIRTGLTVGTRFIIGEYYEAVCEVWCTRAINARSFALVIDSNQGGIQQSWAMESNAAERGFLPNREFKGVLRTPKFRALSAVDGSGNPITLRVAGFVYAAPTISGVSLGNTDAIVRFRNFQFRRIAAYA